MATDNGECLAWCGHQHHDKSGPVDWWDLLLACRFGRSSHSFAFGYALRKPVQFPLLGFLVIEVEESRIEVDTPPLLPVGRTGKPDVIGVEEVEEVVLLPDLPRFSLGTVNIVGEHVVLNELFNICGLRFHDLGLGTLWLVFDLSFEGYISLTIEPVSRVTIISCLVRIIEIYSIW